MKVGDIALAQLQQADGQYKTRPVLLLKQLPPFNDWLVCGVSSQLRQFTPNFDEIIQMSDQDFADSGLYTASLIRLGFLATLPANVIQGAIGSIGAERYRRLLNNLVQLLNRQ